MNLFRHRYKIIQIDFLCIYIHHIISNQEIINSPWIHFKLYRLSESNSYFILQGCAFRKMAVNDVLYNQTSVILIESRISTSYGEYTDKSIGYLLLEHQGQDVAKSNDGLTPP